MKPIQPVTIWEPTGAKQANTINVVSVYDDLLDSATFLWQLYNIEGEQKTFLKDGNIVMAGEDYIQWNLSEDINLQAYVFVCNQINVVLL